MSAKASIASPLVRLAVSRTHRCLALAQPLPPLAPLPGLAAELLLAASAPPGWNGLGRWAGAALITRLLGPVQRHPLRSLGLALGAGLLADVRLAAAEVARIASAPEGHSIVLTHRSGTPVRLLAPESADHAAAHPDMDLGGCPLDTLDAVRVCDGLAAHAC